MTNKYVGPFFFIEGKLIISSVDVSNGEIIGDFINHPESHLQFFNRFNNNCYDDYGHYPRGRVLYNKKINTFYIYADKIITNNKVIIEEIKKEYNLTNERVVIRKDDHYTHDFL